MRQRAAVYALLAVTSCLFVFSTHWFASWEPEDTRRNDRVVVFTTTYYTSSSEMRFDLAVQLCQEAVKRGIALVVVDGSPTAIHKELGLHCPHLYPQTASKSKGGALREAIGHCIQLAGKLTADGTMAGQDLDELALIFTEPEKVDLMRWIARISEPLLKGRANIVVPTRNTQSFMETYPIEQYHTESYGNLVVNAFARSQGLGEGLDWFFGPLAFQKSFAEYWLRDQHAQWEAQLVPIVTAFKTHKPTPTIKAVEVDYRHPARQKELETGNIKFAEKRLMQLSLLIPKLKDVWGVAS